MGLVSFYRNWVKSSYNFGRNISNEITRDMPFKKAGRVGAVVDVAGGAAATGFFGLSTISSAAAIVTGAVTLATATAPLSVPAIVVGMGISALYMGLSALGTATGLGLLKSAKDRNPQVAAATENKVRHAAQPVTQSVSRIVRKLSQAFKKAQNCTPQKAQAPLKSNAASKPARPVI